MCVKHDDVKHEPKRKQTECTHQQARANARTANKVAQSSFASKLNRRRFAQSQRKRRGVKEITSAHDPLHLVQCLRDFDILKPMEHQQEPSVVVGKRPNDVPEKVKIKESAINKRTKVNERLSKAVKHANVHLTCLVSRAG